MKRLLLILALAACSNVEASPVAPSQAFGTVFFRFDPASCTYTGDVTFWIEGVEVGTESLAPGATSTGYQTRASSDFPTFGKPVVQGQVRGYTSSYFRTPVTLWTYRQDIIVPSGGSVTHTFRC